MFILGLPLLSLFPGRMVTDHIVFQKGNRPQRRNFGLRLLYIHAVWLLMEASGLRSLGLSGCLQVEFHHVRFW